MGAFDWLSEVVQLCLTLCDPVDCSLPGSSIHGIFQAKTLEWVAISFSRSSWPRGWTQVSHIVGRRVTIWATREVFILWGFPGGTSVQNPPASAGVTGLIPGSGRSPGESHGNPLQYSCLENPMERGAWQVTVHSVSKRWTQLKQLRTHTFILLVIKSLYCHRYVYCETKSCYCL